MDRQTDGQTERHTHYNNAPNRKQHSLTQSDGKCDDVDDDASNRGVGDRMQLGIVLLTNQRHTQHTRPYALYFVADKSGYSFCWTGVNITGITVDTVSRIQPEVIIPKNYLGRFSKYKQVYKVIWQQAVSPSLVLSPLALENAVVWRAPSQENCAQRLRRTSASSHSKVHYN